MKKIIRSKKLWYVILFCLLASCFLVLFNLAQFQKYQINKRNDERKTEIKTILDGVKKYVDLNNNLPTVSLETDPSQDAGSFLPELLLFEGDKPSGGVSVQLLQNINNFFDPNIKDPSNNPYFIGTYEDKVIVYTNNFEVFQKGYQAYYDYFKLNSGNAGKVLIE